jgi:hypothetical protein
MAVFFEVHRSAFRQGATPEGGRRPAAAGSPAVPDRVRRIRDIRSMMRFPTQFQFSTQFQFLTQSQLLTQ